MLYNKIIHWHIPMLLTGQAVHTHTHAHTHLHTHSHTPTYMYSPWIHKSVTKTVGCGTNHKYTNIHNSWRKILQKFYKKYNMSSLHIKKFTYREKVYT